MENLNIHAPGLEGREGNLGIFREEKQHTVGKFHPNKKERKERNLNLFRKDAGFFALPNFLALWSPLPTAWSNGPVTWGFKIIDNEKGMQMSSFIDWLSLIFFSFFPAGGVTLLACGGRGLMKRIMIV
jgi:hypothetical protein